MSYPASQTKSRSVYAEEIREAEALGEIRQGEALIVRGEIEEACSTLESAIDAAVARHDVPTLEAIRDLADDALDQTVPGELALRDRCRALHALAQDYILAPEHTQIARPPRRAERPERIEEPASPSPVGAPPLPRGKLEAFFEDAGQTPASRRFRSAAVALVGVNIFSWLLLFLRDVISRGTWEIELAIFVPLYFLVSVGFPVLLVFLAVRLAWSRQFTGVFLGLLGVLFFPMAYVLPGPGHDRALEYFVWFLFSGTLVLSGLFFLAADLIEKFAGTPRRSSSGASAPLRRSPSEIGRFGRRLFTSEGNGEVLQRGSVTVGEPREAAGAGALVGAIALHVVVGALGSLYVLRAGWGYYESLWLLLWVAALSVIVWRWRRFREGLGLLTQTSIAFLISAWLAFIPLVYFVLSERGRRYAGLVRGAR